MIKKVYISVLLLVLCFSYKLKGQCQGEWKVLIIAATEEKGGMFGGGIGDYVQQVMNTSVKNFETMADKLGLCLSIDSVSGHDLSATNVRLAVNKLASYKKPAVGNFMCTVLSFTHGIADQNSPLPFLLCSATDRIATRENIYSLQNVYNILRLKSSYDNIHVWGELCNNFANDYQSISAKNVINTKRRGQSENLKKLLFSVASEIIVSASKGQKSYIGADGGIFSSALFNNLQSVIDGSIEPKFKGVNGFFENVITTTELKAYEQNVEQSPLTIIGEID